MTTATVSPFIDKWHPKDDKNSRSKKICAVSIRVTCQRKKKYYSTGMSLPAKEFERIMTAKRRSEVDKAIYNKIHSFENKAINAIKSLAVFTFDQFENIYLENRDAADSIAFGFDDYIKELREEGRIGTAVSYHVAKVSLEKFRPGLKFADITKTLLSKYEHWMVASGKSRTTVGIYLRSLRTIFNRARIDKNLYPFGEETKGKYSIPTGRNIKKALTLNQIAQIFSYLPKTTGEVMAKDYWVFIYLCNGLNVKDLCLLRWKNINGNVLSFERSKTMRSKRDGKKIIVSLKPQAREVIARWGQRSINPDCYVFPHLQKGITPEREREIIQQLTKTINKYMKRIGKDLGIAHNITTYTARHSFASILKRSGANASFISDSLGHSSITTTEHYLAGFEEEAIHKTTDALIDFQVAN